MSGSSRPSATLRHAVIGLALLFAAAAGAQQAPMYPMEPPPEPDAIPLHTGGVEGQALEESWFRQWGDPMARNISRATLTPFLPEPGKATGAAVIVAPGGGFLWLSMGNEGWEVAEALAEQGVAAFVLKYRLRPTPASLEDFAQTMNDLFSRFDDDESDGEPAERPELPFPTNPVADAEAAYAMIVARAKEWGVDPARLGMMGFSAGAGATMATTLNSDKVDFAFIAPVYGGMQAVEVPADAPPMFAVIATDDFLFGGEFGLIRSWFDAGRPVEFHLYQNGGHGFGLGNPDRTSNAWFDAFMHWLDVNGFLAPVREQGDGSDTSGN
ncbi:MAG TPA: alpha/beta hydrolase [Woeseiaceae bacterium]|nr:alpha/beta hydrolase [Woeseiaceae bacterium]